MGCVIRTARRRRLQARKDPRYRYGNRSPASQAKRLAEQLARDRAMSARKGKKK